MSTPYENEYGDWFNTNNEVFFERNLKSRLDHIPFFKSIQKYKDNGLKYDEKLKEQALLNIKKNPIKYFKNWIFNISRTFTNSPKTNKEMFSISFFQPLSSIFFSFIFVMFLLSCAYFLLFYRNSYLTYLTVFCLIYFLGISLISSMQRFLFPLYPLVLFIITQFIVEFSKQNNLKNS